MRFRTSFGGLALAGALFAGGEATACAIIPVVRVGPPPTARERAAEEEARRRDFIRHNRANASAALAAGGDPSSELARLLVPNIRPVPIRNSDCGPMNEIDRGEGQETAADLLAGTYLASHSDAFPGATRPFEESPGAACNAEFRDRFSAFLRQRLDARHLRAAYLFLASRWAGPGTPIHRLVRFEGRLRRPPVQWDTWFEEDIARWTRNTVEGRVLQSALNDFWRDSAASLETPDRACPAAAARWPAVQGRLIAEIEGRYPLARRLRRETR